MTYAATVAQLLLLGCKVTLVDCDVSLQMEEQQVTELIESGTKIDAIVVPSLYADAAVADNINTIALCNDICCLEDAAETFGCFVATAGGPTQDFLQHAGTFGQMGTFSFFANKVITCGEGGAIVTDSDQHASFLRKFINQGVSGRFWHDMIGTNFRMTNMQAAVGCAQFEDLETILNRKRLLAKRYREGLDYGYCPIVPLCIRSSEWMPVFRLPPGKQYGEFQSWMTARDIEVRPIFTPIHRMPAFAECKVRSTVIADDAYQTHCILPSSPGLTPEEINTVIDAANAFVVS